MAFYEGRKQRSTFNNNTKAFQLYNPNPEIGSTIGLGFWNTYMSISINPVLPESEQDGNRQYNYDVGMNTVMGVNNINSLYNAIKKLEAEVLAIKKSKKENPSSKKKSNDPSFVSYSIILKDIVLKVGYGPEYEGIAEDEYFIAAISVNQKLVSTGEIAMFVFADSGPFDIIMRNFDESEGKAEKKAKMNSNWNIFKNFITTVATDTLGTSAHNANYNCNRIVTGIAEKLDMQKEITERLMVGGGSKEQSSSGSTFGNRSGGKFANRRGTSSSKTMGSKKGGFGSSIREDMDVDSVSTDEIENLIDD